MANPAPMSRTLIVRHVTSFNFSMYHPEPTFPCYTNVPLGATLRNFAYFAGFVLQGATPCAWLDINDVKDLMADNDGTSLE